MIDSSLFSRCAIAVHLAEIRFGNGHGSDKLTFALQYVKKYFPYLDEFEIRSTIENILSLPSKKKGGK